MQSATAAAFNAWAEEKGWPAFCDDGLVFESPFLAELLEIWRKQAGERPIPRRREMTARALKTHLTQIAIFERVSEEPSRYRTRLMGTKLAQILGDMQGKFLDDAAPPETVERWHTVLDLVLSEKRPLRFFNPVAYKQREYLQAESIGAPLTESDGPPTMVLVCAVFKANFSSAEEVA
ncbi:MAG: PAS domain-containing protein [Alphaproteobacteria bacterium]|nr:PAS domain-containing protein [Alphaproteobacteria bacterium]